RWQHALGCRHAETRWHEHVLRARREHCACIMAMGYHLATGKVASCREVDLQVGATGLPTPSSPSELSDDNLACCQLRLDRQQPRLSRGAAPVGKRNRQDPYLD